MALIFNIIVIWFMCFGLTFIIRSCNDCYNKFKHIMHKRKLKKEEKKASVVNSCVSDTDGQGENVLPVPSSEWES